METYLLGSRRGQGVFTGATAIFDCLHSPTNWITPLIAVVNDFEHHTDGLHLSEASVSKCFGWPLSSM